jgi:hypothetical protein
MLSVISLKIQTNIHKMEVEEIGVANEEHKILFTFSMLNNTLLRNSEIRMKILPLEIPPSYFSDMEPFLFRFHASKHGYYSESLINKCCKFRFLESKTNENGQIRVKYKLK